MKYPSYKRFVYGVGKNVRNYHERKFILCGKDLNDEEVSRFVFSELEVILRKRNREGRKLFIDERIPQAIRELLISRLEKVDLRPIVRRFN